MVKVTFLEQSGTQHVLDVEPGITLMEAAINNMVPGIQAECGGACSCGTCHIYVPEEWADRLPERTDLENAMLDMAVGVDERSRLACRIEITDALDDIVVTVPEPQY